jgi:hypothetical protein
MHFFHTFGSSPDELNISIGHTVGNSHLAIAYAQNAKNTELTENRSGSSTSKSVTQVQCVNQLLNSRKQSERVIREFRKGKAKAKKKAKETKERKQNNGRFKSIGRGRKTKKTDEKSIESSGEAQVKKAFMKRSLDVEGLENLGEAQINKNQMKRSRLA